MVNVTKAMDRATKKLKKGKQPDFLDVREILGAAFDADAKRVDDPRLNQLRVIFKLPQLPLKN